MKKSKELIDRLIENKITEEEFELFLSKIGDEKAEQEMETHLKSYFDQLIEENDKKRDGNPAKEDHSHEIMSAIGPEEQTKTRKLPRIALRIAASVALILSAYFTLPLLLNQKESKQLTAEKASAPLLEKITPKGKMLKMNLSDGSLIHLNADSRIRYPETFPTEKRQVELSGEAYFDVAHNPEKPFIIAVNDLRVEVLGTSFNIKAYNNEDKITVTVESGKVKVAINALNKNFIYLTPDQKLTLNTSTGAYTTAHTESEDELAWRKGVLHFNETPIAEVEHTIERWYGVNITMADPEVYEMKFNGDHKNEHLTSVLETLIYVLNSDYEVKGKEIIIKKK